MTEKFYWVVLAVSFPIVDKSPHNHLHRKGVGVNVFSNVKRRENKERNCIFRINIGDWQLNKANLNFKVIYFFLPIFFDKLMSILIPMEKCQ